MRLSNIYVVKFFFSVLYKSKNYIQLIYMNIKTFRERPNFHCYVQKSSVPNHIFINQNYEKMCHTFIKNIFLHFEKSLKMAKNCKKMKKSLIQPRYGWYPKPGFQIPVPPLN